MYLVHFFYQPEYQFCMSLHSSLAEAKDTVDDMLRIFDINESGDEPNPTRDQLFDSNGEGVQLFRITCDGGAPERIQIDPVAEPVTA
jgi:hypothetical protein